MKLCYSSQCTEWCKSHLILSVEEESVNDTDDRVICVWPFVKSFLLERLRECVNAGGSQFTHIKCSLNVNFVLVSVNMLPLVSSDFCATLYTILINRFYFLDIIFLFGPGRVVGIATAYGLDGPGIESRWGEIFCTSPDRPLGLPSLLYNGYRVFPGGKVLPGRDADPSPPSGAEVKNRVELYLCSS